MSDRLKDGTKLLTANGNTVYVDGFLGEGGQGNVYRVRTPHGDLALKWYHRTTATQEQGKNLRRLCELGHSDPRFLWPIEFVDDVQRNSFGYLMELRPSDFSDIPDLLTRRVSGATLRTLYAMGIGMAEAFRSLHARGLAYRDISWGNVFFRAPSGEVLICDNDNAVFADQNAEINGTMKFMAPELVRGEGRPKVETDLHSLAVLLFMVLVNGHPLEGAREANMMCLDAESERELYGSLPVFIYDPVDHSNRPVPGIHDTVMATWPAVPTAVQELFMQAFGPGLKDPAQRVTEWTWIRTLSALHDNLFMCSACGRLNVYDESQHRRTGVVGICWKCQAALSPPLRLKAGQRSVVLDPNTKLYQHHIDSRADHDFTSTVAEMVAHPTKPGKYGLRNVSPYTWTSTARDGTVADVPAKGVLQLRNGLTFEIAGARFSVQ